MNSRQIQVFLTAATCRSFAEAASRCYLSPASVCRSVAAMEEELGFFLFSRSNTQISLTEAGEVYYRGMKELVEQYSILKSSALRCSYQSELRICILDGQMMDAATQTALRTFEQSTPSVRVVLFRRSYGTMLPLLDKGEADLILTIDSGIRGQKNLLIQDICALTTKLVIPQQHRLARRSGCQLSDFCNERFIACADTPASASFIDNCRQAGFEPLVLTAPDIQTQMLWLEAGRGIAVANPNHMMCNSPSLTEIELPELSPRTFVAAWHRNNQSENLQIFLKCLRTACLLVQSGDIV